MPGPFIHAIDPVIGAIGGVYLWWYGFSYTFGILVGFYWIRGNRGALALSRSDVYLLTILIAIGVLLGGRAVEIAFYEWSYYREHPGQITAIWLGGMSTHGILLGATLALLLFCRLRRRSFLEIADVIVIAAAFIMGVGRLGNFVDGQISGAVTEMWWGVKFPDLDGYRHPVVLYDGIKNLLLIPLLLYIRSRRPPRGVIVANFILWYGLLRIFIDLFREYRVSFHLLPPGQEFNLAMALIGVALLIWIYRRAARSSPPAPPPAPREPALEFGLWPKRALLLSLLLLPLVIPSDWTQDVPARYGERHPGIVHSWWYPTIPERHPDLD